jgi:hypothetical protein
MTMAEKIIVESVKDSIAVGSGILESAQNEVVWLLPPEMLVFSAQFGLTKKSKTLIEKGGSVRGITHITNTYGNVIRQLVDIGEEVRHIDRYQGAFMLVGDKKQSISSVYLNLEELSLDDQITAFWTDDQAYADYLMATFEAAWKGAVDAKKMLQEL